MAGQRGRPGRGAPRRRRGGEGRYEVAPVNAAAGRTANTTAPQLRQYAALTDRALRRALEEAGRGDSLVEEVGALRVVLLRLLAESGDDPADLAATIPRVVNATVRALRARRALADDAGGDLAGALTRALAEMGLSE